MLKQPDLMICSLYVRSQIINLIFIWLHNILRNTTLIIDFDSALGCIRLIHHVLLILDAPPLLSIEPLLLLLMLLTVLLLLLHCKLDLGGIQCS